MNRQPTEPTLPTTRRGEAGARCGGSRGDTVVEVAFRKRKPQPYAMSDHGWYHEAAVADDRTDPAPRRR